MIERIANLRPRTQFHSTFVLIISLVSIENNIEDYNKVLGKQK